MSVLEYFQAVNIKKVSSGRSYNDSQLGSIVSTKIENIEGFDIVLFDVEEERGSPNNEGCSLGANEIRKYLYQLYGADYMIKFADLGTIKAGDSVTDTYFALQECITHFIKNNVLPIIIGGSQDLLYANYLAYTKLEQMVNLVSVDARFALGETDERINSDNVFSKIILHQPNVLFNFSNLAYQSYLINQTELKLLNELFFDGYRLGALKEDIRLAEPIIRNADFLNFNLSAIAQPYAPANNNSSPNGLNGEQACQISRYAGMSDKLTSFGVFEFNNTLNHNGQTPHLVAQMIWYFIDGFYNRKQDFPACTKKKYTKYIVNIEEGNQEIVFYKSPKSDRWWMEVPYHSNLLKKYERHLMLPCSYEDYLTAMDNEIPERWFQTFKKLK